MVLFYSFLIVKKSNLSFNTFWFLCLICITQPQELSEDVNLKNKSQIYNLISLKNAHWFP